MMSTLATLQVLELAGIEKAFGATVVLDGVALLINRGDRIGLIGENGSGKTTLARIITGESLPDAGQCRLTPTMTIGYLPQEATMQDGLSVRGYLDRAMGGLDTLRERLAAAEAALAVPGLPKAQLEPLLTAYGELQEAYAARGGYEADYRIDQVFAGLGIAHIGRDRELVTLSGGEKTRVMLAGLLLSAPDLLILDEPTNHLDFAALNWLERYLAGYGGAVLAISHDRRFLNAVVTQIASLSAVTHRLTVYPGNYDAYLAAREREQAKQAAAYEQYQGEVSALQQEIKAKAFSAGKGRPRSDNDKFAKGFFAGRAAVLQSREIANAKQRLETLLENPVDRPERRWRIDPDFAPAPLVAREALRLTGVSKAYGGRPVLHGVTATVRAGEHVVLYGPNGCGKSTLIKILLGLETPDSGTCYHAPGAVIGYLDQEQESLNPALTALETYRRGRVGPEGELRAALHRYAVFSDDQALRPVSALSVGQRRKLQIAGLIADRANILILDEPTNHLDLDSIEQFEAAIRDFPGTVLAVSHDRTFIERVAHTCWTLRDGVLITE